MKVAMLLDMNEHVISSITGIHQEDITIDNYDKMSNSVS